MIVTRAIILAAALPLLAGGAPPDPLGELDRGFHAAYAVTRSGAQERQGAVLVVAGDSLLLFRDQARVSEALIRPPRYHRLKRIAHVPLAIRLQALPWAGPALGAEGRAGVEGLRGLVAAAAEAEPAPILGASLAFLDGVLAGGSLAPEALDAYCASLRGAMEATLAEAAGLELEALAGAVARWRKGPLARDWEAVRVVVIGSHMAREGEVAWQFFSRLLEQEREGGRLVFAEEKWAPADALKLLATHAVDGDLGRAFFGDPERMHRDVLAEGAKKWLESHPPAR